jgi:hypothetical protein
MLHYPNHTDFHGNNPTSSQVAPTGCGTHWHNLKNDGGSEYQIVPQNTVGCSAYRFLEFKKKTKGGNALYRTRNAEREYEGGTLGDFLSGPHASNDTHIFHPFHPYWATM